MMSLLTLFDNFPISTTRLLDVAVRPLLCSILNSLEDQMEQKVGQVFTRLPAIMLDLEDEYESREQSGRQRKLRSEAVSKYEPITKVVVTNKDNKFQISLDTSNYEPEEITVKVVNAKHEAKRKDVYKFYEMYRSFNLPEHGDLKQVTSRLSANGELTVEAPLSVSPETIERNIPVTIEGKQQQQVVE